MLPVVAVFVVIADKTKQKMQRMLSNLCSVISEFSSVIAENKSSLAKTATPPHALPSQRSRRAIIV